MYKPNQPTLTSGQIILSIIQRVERIEEEIAGLRADKTDIMREAKSNGFDTKTIARLIKERKMSEQERIEAEALLELYKAAIGMLDGTPLGAAAIARLQKKPDTKADAGNGDPSGDDLPTEEKPITAEDIEQARNEGHAAAISGKPVISNPFPANDKRRAAYDEGWCQAAGSDGMDIPDAWRPSKKERKKSGNEDHEG